MRAYYMDPKNKNMAKYVHFNPMVVANNSDQKIILQRYRKHTGRNSDSAIKKLKRSTLSIAANSSDWEKLILVMNNPGKLKVAVAGEITFADPEKQQN